MNQLVFQASRRQLAAQISSVLDKDAENKNLRKVLEAADEQVKKLEYWSDLKEVTQNGMTATIDADETGHSGGGKIDTDNTIKGKGKERAL